MSTLSPIRRTLVSLSCAALTLSTVSIFGARRAQAQETAGGATAQAEAREDAKPAAAAPTVATADSLEYDMKNRTAHLRGNVHVVDNEMNLHASKMVIHFTYSEATERDEVTRIVADGEVVITREAVKATGQRAVYDVDQGEVVLTGEPVLLQGNSRITGATQVIFNRAEERAYTQGGKPKIEFYRSDSEQDSAIDIFGNGKRDTAQTDAYTR